nr:ARID DNA-binding domain-containing protein [Tanacetum cinerariifolium]
MGGYISVNFCQEFDTIGEILGLSRKNRGKVKDCYMKNKTKTIFCLNHGTLAGLVQEQQKMQFRRIKEKWSTLVSNLKTQKMTPKNNQLSHTMQRETAYKEHMQDHQRYMKKEDQAQVAVTTSMSSLEGLSYWEGECWRMQDHNPSLSNALPGPIPQTIDGNEIHLFGLYKLIEGMGGYISVNFCQEFDTIGEILGLSRKNGGKVKDCYMKNKTETIFCLNHGTFVRLVQEQQKMQFRRIKEKWSTLVSNLKIQKMKPKNSQLSHTMQRETAYKEHMQDHQRYMKKEDQVQVAVTTSMSSLEGLSSWEGE